MARVFLRTWFGLLAGISLVMAQVMLEIGSASGPAGAERVPVAISMQNEEPVAGLQFLLTDDEEVLMLDSAAVGERAREFTVLYHRNHVLLFSLEGDSIPPGKGGLLHLFVRVDSLARSAIDTLRFAPPPLLADPSGEPISDFRVLPGPFAIGGETAVRESPENLPDRYRLDQNYPNPFNPVTRIRFALKQPGPVTLQVFDRLGREVKRLVDTPLEAGIHTIVFDADGLSSGIYFYRISVNGFTQTRKMIYLK